MDIIHQGLWMVVEGGGTGGQARVRGISVSGKTGTAQVVSRRLDDVGGHKIPRPHSWFVGYAPSEDPQIAVAVIIEHSGDGFTTAAPVVRQIMEAYFAPKIKPPKKTSTSPETVSGEEFIETQQEDVIAVTSTNVLSEESIPSTSELFTRSRKPERE